MENLEETLKKYPLIALIILLSAISCFAVASAAPIMTNIANPYMLWLKQGLYYVLGGALSYIIYKIGQDTLYTHIKTLYMVFIVLLIGLAVDHFVYTKLLHIHIVPLAKFTNGATSWYNIPGFSFQPSEFMKIIMVMYLAKITQEYNDRILVKTTDSEIQYIIQVMKISLPPAILIYLQNDSGVMMIIMAAVFFVLLSSGMNGNWFLFILVIAVVGVLGMAYLFIYQNGVFTSIISGHKLDRIYGWLDPEGTTGNQGLQSWYAQLSYGTAGWFGHGFRAVVKVFPEGQTDFIFSVIATDFGYVGALITLLAIAAFDITILNIGLKSDNIRDKTFIMGTFGCLIFQQIWNIGMILGLLPITGITLPMLSYGGSSLLSYMFAMGIIIDIDYQNKLRDVKHKQY